MTRTNQTLRNDPSKAGQTAGRATFIGSDFRFAIRPIHTRFDRVAFFAFDAEKVDEVTGGPAVACQRDTLAEVENWVRAQ